MATQLIITSAPSRCASILGCSGLVFTGAIHADSVRTFTSTYYRALNTSFRYADGLATNIGVHR